jgi:hypothetical protein
MACAVWLTLLPSPIAIFSRNLTKPARLRGLPSQKETKEKKKEKQLKKDKQTYKKEKTTKRPVK